MWPLKVETARTFLFFLHTMFKPVLNDFKPDKPGFCTHFNYEHIQLQLTLKIQIKCIKRLARYHKLTVYVLK